MNKQTAKLLKDLNARIKSLEKASNATMQSIQEIKDQCILVEQALAEKDKQVAEKNKLVAEKNKLVAEKSKPVAEKNKPVVVHKPREASELQNILNSLPAEDRLKFIEKYLK
jgi:septal ring factor EnvC (AmiA/AmiB activator)